MLSEFPFFKTNRGIFEKIKITNLQYAIENVKNVAFAAIFKLTLVSGRKYSMIKNIVSITFLDGRGILVLI